MKTGLAVALAWPETYCKQAGGWYDSFLKVLGFNQGHYYQAGHAALILIRKFDTEIHYFDFGRYHAPKGFGRVRSAKTDPELTLPLLAEWTPAGDLINLLEIMKALNTNPSYHGDGILYASETEVDFDRAVTKAREIQDRSPVKYGPFTFGGSNCSRFVNTVLLHSKPGIIKWLRLYFPYMLTPTPMSNVRSLGKVHKDGQPNSKGIPICSNPKKLLPEPLKPNSIPSRAHWLSGEGSGSWFIIDEFFEDFLIHRFSPSSQVEFSGVFGLADSSIEFNVTLPFQVIHLSHFQTVNIQQDYQRISLKLKESRNLKSVLDLEVISNGSFRKIMVN